jgi:ADP-ribosylglycohydrolase
MNRLLDRIAGCLVGGLIGDALGGPAEGKHYRLIEQQYGEITDLLDYGKGPAGTATDDSALKHMLCEAILRAGGPPAPDHWAEVWRERMQLRMFYTPVVNAYYKVFVQGVPPREAGRGNMVSNSSAMCISPIGIIDAGDPAAAVRDAYYVTQLIHSGFPQDGACAAAAAVAAALLPDATAESVVEASWRYLDPSSEMPRYIQTAVELALTEGDYRRFREAYYRAHLLPWPGNDEATGRSTAVDPRESVPVALALFALARGDAVRTVVYCANFGRDADTIATIGGSIAGALQGRTAFPERWVHTVEARNQVDQTALAQQLYDVLLRRIAQQEVRCRALRSMQMAS